MIQLWIVAGSVADLADISIPALSFNNVTGEEIKQLINFARENGYSVGIEFIDDG